MPLPFKGDSPYPNTKQLEEYFESPASDAIKDIPWDRKFTLKEAYDILKSCLGEYEHGSADVDCVFTPNGIGEIPDAMKWFFLEMYEAVLEDVILTLAYSPES